MATGGVVNANAGGRTEVVDGGPAECGAVGVMEVVWPSGVALRGEASNRHLLRWLKTVVVSEVEKAPVTASDGDQEDERE